MAPFGGREWGRNSTGLGNVIRNLHQWDKIIRFGQQKLDLEHLPELGIDAEVINLDCRGWTTAPEIGEVMHSLTEAWTTLPGKVA